MLRKNKKFTILLIFSFIGFLHLTMVVVCSIGTAANVDCGQKAVINTDTGLIECGQELGPGGSFILDRDLDCMKQCFGLIVIGPAVLDMNGKTISNAETGILIEGKGAKIFNGSVSECLDGVVLTGKGKHQIIKVIARNNKKNGFLLETGESNFFEKDQAINNFESGFYIRSDKNAFVDILSAANKKKGIYVQKASNNLFENSTIENNKGTGFSLKMADHNKLINSKVVNNVEQEGIKIDKDSYENSFINTIVQNNGVKKDREDGFDIRGQRNTFINCTSIGHLGDGFKISGAENFLKENQAIKNAGNGIHILEGSLNNTLLYNNAKNNSRFDLRDDNIKCEVNHWIKNTFKTIFISKDCVRLKY